MIWHYAPFGGGFGSFEAAYKIVEPVNLLSLQYLNHAHNDYLELAIEAGLPGLALAGLWIVLIGWLSWRAVVPAPATLWLLFGALVALSLRQRRLAKV